MTFYVGYGIPDRILLRFRSGRKWRPLLGIGSFRRGDLEIESGVLELNCYAVTRSAHKRRKLRYVGVS